MGSEPMIKLLYNTPQNWAEGVVAAMDDLKS
jgi:hypothetical protein